MVCVKENFCRVCSNLKVIWEGSADMIGTGSMQSPVTNITRSGRFSSAGYLKDGIKSDTQNCETQTSQSDIWKLARKQTDRNSDALARLFR